ncbi:hypothetical protein DPEC_G00178800 [Dallia pectoralis]|uniref:Uncharacterized protein n=1 Tax=Dallia pectoralis TaxID=75939 RepID=A0ACC2GFB2_DALPE|nr:hypothetical protein DPEC_G00178800 [Dallia pectoralis]
MWNIKPPMTYALETKYKSYIEFNRATQSGVIFDDVIRPGLEEPGELGGPMTVGCAAGDAQSYILFCDFFDQVIEAYQNHKMISLQKSDFNYDNLKGGEDFDQGYALSCEVSAMRAVDDFSFPIHCSRGERRELLKQAKKAFDQFTDTLPGKLYSVAELSNNPEDKIANIVAPSISQFRNGLARDWPDSRAVWISNDRTLLVWVNIYDHLRLVTTRDDANIAKAFQCICVNLLRLEALYKKMRHPFIWKQQLGWVVSSPADVGTGLRASIRVKLQQLPRHKHLKDILRRLRLRMENTDCIGVYNISNAQTIGMDEVGFTQLVVDGVKLLIRMEKRLEIKENIADLIPLQK